MRHRRSIALRALAQLRQGQHAVVSAAHTLPATRRFTFRNAHSISSLKFQFIKFSPRRRGFPGLTGAIFTTFLRRLRQTATLSFTQRSLRKGEENIFPHKRSQVHAVVANCHLIVAFQRQKASPIRQIHGLHEWLQATGTLTIELQLQVPCHLHTRFRHLDIQVIL